MDEKCLIVSSIIKTWNNKKCDEQCERGNEWTEGGVGLTNHKHLSGKCSTTSRYFAMFGIKKDYEGSNF